ncbi:hypothetical protein [Kiloniella sp.]|uniref:hypothetical protein n=1 Tax=Kiloniella sp. TaxID=1938587 RepID=UPI003B0120B8
MLRDIQVQIDNNIASKTRLAAALQLSAKLDGTHIIGVHALKTPEAILHGAPHGVIGYFPEEVIENQRDAIQKQAAELEKSFTSTVSEVGATYEWRQLYNCQQS